LKCGTKLYYKEYFYALSTEIRNFTLISTNNQNNFRLFKNINKKKGIFSDENQDRRHRQKDFDAFAE
jgi:hypothetical protein